MRILFWGTPGFATASLRALLGEGYDVVGVVTQPERQAGRGRKLKASEVQQVAAEEGLPVFMPERPRGDAFLGEVAALLPDLSIVAAYGHIIPPEILDLPTHGSMNVHASLLPELRGAAPVHWALVRGHDRTGVTIMQMTEGLDEGPILLQRDLPILEDDTTSGVYMRLAELGAEALMEALALLETDALEPRPQEPERATYAPKVSRETARIDWSKAARDVANHMRGMDSIPGAWTLLGGEPIKLFRPTVLDEARTNDRGLDAGDPEPQPEPGTLLAPDSEGLVVATGHGGRVLVREVQVEGKRRMGAPAWLRGQRSLQLGRFT